MFCSLFSFVQKLYSNLSNLISYVGQLLPSTLFKYIPTNSLIFVLFEDFKSFLKFIIKFFSLHIFNLNKLSSGSFEL